MSTRTMSHWTMQVALDPIEQAIEEARDWLLCTLSTRAAATETARERCAGDPASPHVRPRGFRTA